MTTTLTVPRRTRSKLARTLFAGVAAATLATGALSTIAEAEDARIDEVIFDVTPTPFAAIVKVTSNNGEKWTSIQPTEIAFDARIKIDTKGSGYIEQYAVFLGACSNPSCGAHPKLLWETVLLRDMDRSGTIRLSSSLLQEVDSGMGNSYATAIINRCNTRPVTEAHGFRRPVDASMSANTRKAAAVSQFLPPEVGSPFAGGDVNRTDQFEIQVECVPVTRSSTVERKPDPHRTKVDVQNIDLFLSTYAVPETGPRGTTCKPLKVTTRIGTDKAGPKNVKLWRQVNGGPITSESKQMHAEALGDGKFGDDWNKFEQFTKTTTVQYKAEILGGTFAPSTPWKSITIHCNGDYAPPPNTSNPDNTPPRGRPQAELPPTIVTPPPLCGTKAAKVRGSTPCIKTAPLPDKRQQWADQKRKQQAAEEKRKSAAREAELRRREAALNSAELQQRQQIHRPMLFGRFGGPGRFAGPGRPMRGPVMGVGLHYKTF
jgi:hypothetical protein